MSAKSGTGSIIMKNGTEQGGKEQQKKTSSKEEVSYSHKGFTPKQRICL